MSGWIYPVIGIAIVGALLGISWLLERRSPRGGAWWREPAAGDYLDLRPRQIGRRHWRYGGQSDVREEGER